MSDRIVGDSPDLHSYSANLTGRSVVLIPATVVSGHKSRNWDSMLEFRVQLGGSRERMRALTRSQRFLRYKEMSLTLSPFLSIPQV